MHIHILGVCGTFMAGVAKLAKELGFNVTGYDNNAYPPMSTLLEELGVNILPLDADALIGEVDLVIIGNALSRGNKLVEYVLANNIPFTSGAAWLHDYVLQDKWVLAVSGTHGKTTTSSMLAWVLEYAGSEPGFLIGGLPLNFSTSARLGKNKFFVLEADEYDTAFFDKRSKFVHYHPKTLIINNLEFDHADIFNNLDEIKKQFHHLIRTVPGNGKVITNAEDKNIKDLLQMGLWSNNDTFGLHLGNYTAEKLNDAASNFTVYKKGDKIAEVSWNLIGEHNILNALSVFVAAEHLTIKPEVVAKALVEFKTTARRLELKNTVNGIKIYDDFAHHPTAVKYTIDSLKLVEKGRVVAVIDLASNTMCDGTHRETILMVASRADIAIILHRKNTDWDVLSQIKNSSYNNLYQASSEQDVADILNSNKLKNSDSIVVMSNSAVNLLHTKLLDVCNMLSESIDTV